MKDTAPLRVDSVIFDIDGTLFDTTHTVARAWNAAMSGLAEARRFTADEVAACCGLTDAELLRRIFPDLAADIRQEWGRHCRAKEAEALALEGRMLMPGVLEMLETLRTSLPLFTVSNCQSGYGELLFAKGGVTGFFLDTECHGDTGRSKGENIGSLMARNGLKAPVYLGDTAGDQEAAGLAGAAFVHAAYGFGGTLKNCRAIAHPDQFAPLLTNIQGKSLEGL